MTASLPIHRTRLTRRLAAVITPLANAAEVPAADPTSIWSGNPTPANPSENDPASVELGVKFRSDVAGYITGVRFYKGTSNNGTHTGNLWSSTGTRLATAVFSGESASGWQQVTFSAPVAISAATTSVASYHTTSGNYADDAGAFASAGVDNGPLGGHQPQRATIYVDDLPSDELTPRGVQCRDQELP